MGIGNRFVFAGYKDPKPMIMVRGKRIIEYICDMFDRENDEFIFICNSDHIRDYFYMRPVLESVVRKSTVITRSPHSIGPVYTIVTSGIDSAMDENEPVVVSYCDVPFVWDYNKFKEFVKDKDGCIVNHTGFHPHTLSSTMFAYSKITDDNRILEIKEKSCYTDNRFNEPASSGVYYFSKWLYIYKYFNQLIDENVNYNGEFYVTLVYNLMIRDKLRVYSYLNDYTVSLGTPCDVENFMAWMTILGGGQVKSEEDVLDCYRYWMNYINKVPYKIIPHKNP